MRKLNKQIKASESYPIANRNLRPRKCVVTPQTILYYTIDLTEAVSPLFLTPAKTPIPGASAASGPHH